MGITIRDVAERVGVSAASVSLVLNYKECRISEETKQRIFDAAKELGYEIKKNKKQSGASCGGKIIGVIYSSLDHALTAECIQGIENYASIYGYHSFHMYCSNLSQKCAEQIEIAASLGAAGLIVIPPIDMNTGNNNILLGEALKKAGIPYLLLDKAIYKVFCDFVTADNKLGTNMAVDYLIGFGHRKIGILAGKEGIYNTRKRVEGYIEGLALKGIELEESFVYYGDYSVEAGISGTGYLMSKGVTAIIACNEALAVGVYEYAKEHGKRVGEDISVVGFANIREAKWLNPKLTCVSQPGEQMGRKAAEIIVSRIRREDLGSVKTNYFTPSLVQGGSVKGI